MPSHCTRVAEAEVHILEAIGVAEPVSIMIDTDGSSENDEESLVKAVRKTFPLTPQGIIEVGQMPAAIAALESAVAAEAPQGAGDDGAAKADRVSLRQRVWPMVEMMKRTLAEDQPITWGT